jgi:hypothetical protein
MHTLAVPINKAETITLAAAHLIQKGVAANGRGILIQADQMAEIEGGIARPRTILMGEETLGLFKVWAECSSRQVVIFASGEKRKQRTDIA